MKQVRKEPVLSKMDYNTALAIAIIAAEAVAGALVSLQSYRLRYDEDTERFIIEASTALRKEGKKDVPVRVLVYFRLEKGSAPPLVDVEVWYGKEPFFKFLLPPMKGRSGLDELDLEEIRVFEKHIQALI